MICRHFNLSVNDLMKCGSLGQFKTKSCLLRLYRHFKLELFKIYNFRNSIWQLKYYNDRIFQS